MKYKWVFIIMFFKTVHHLGQYNANKCTFPEGIYTAIDTPKEEWNMEVIENQVIEKANNEKITIYSNFIKASHNECKFIMTVTKILGNETEIKIGDKYLTTINNYINNQLHLRIETKKTGVDLVLIKQK